MNRVRPVLIYSLVALFALGAVVHAVSVTTMKAGMAMADMRDGGTGGCQSCPTDGGAEPLCDMICLTPFVALPILMSAALTPADFTYDISTDRDSPGLSAPPDTNPPRPLIHS